MLKTRKHKKGVLKYVLLPYFAASKSDLSVDQVSESSTEMTTEIFTNILDGLHSLISSLDAGTAAAIAAMATGGLAGAKVAAQSVFYGRKNKKNKNSEVDENLETQQLDSLENDVTDPIAAI